MSQGSDGKAGEPETGTPLTGLDAAPRLRRRSIEIFLKHGPLKIETMREALAEGESETLATSAHALIGSAGFMGATRLADLAKALEDLARERPVSECAASLRNVETEYLRVVAELEGILAGAAGATGTDQP